MSTDLHREFERYITPIISERGGRVVTEGGMPDHIHLLIDLGRELSIAVALREIKSKSSKWLKGKIREEFSWQGGYGFFSVSPNHIQGVINYIANQEKHHEHKTFQEEFEEMLQAAGVQYDPVYLWEDLVTTTE